MSYIGFPCCSRSPPHPLPPVQKTLGYAVLWRLKVYEAKIINKKLTLVGPPTSRATLWWVGRHGVSRLRKTFDIYSHNVHTAHGSISRWPRLAHISISLSSIHEKSSGGGGRKRKAFPLLRQHHPKKNSSFRISHLHPAPFPPPLLHKRHRHCLCG